MVPVRWFNIFCDFVEHRDYSSIHWFGFYISAFNIDMNIVDVNIKCSQISKHISWLFDFVPVVRKNVI